MDTCSSCRFWLDYERRGGWDDNWRACRRAESGSRGSRMQVHAADDYDLQLRTAPDFGCADWQAVGAGIPQLRHRDGRVTAQGVENVREDTWAAPDYAVGEAVLVNRHVDDVRNVPGVQGAQWPDPAVYPRPAVSVAVTVVGVTLEPEWDRVVAEARARLAQHTTAST